MTNPPQRPGQPGWRGRGTPPPDPATHRLPRPGGPDAPTEQIRARRADAAPTEQIRRPPPPARPAAPQFPRPAGPQHPRPPGPPRSQPPLPPPPPAPGPKQPDATRRGGFFNRQTTILLAILVVALLAGGLSGAELYARHRADGVLVAVAECVVEDGATISYGVNPPFLWQHITGRYTNISVHTAGDRVQSADGMTADITLADVWLQDSGDSKGTIGTLDATLTWTADGIKDTVAANLPGVGSLVTGVTTDPAAGTLVMEAGSSSVTAQPVVTDGDLNLEVLDVTGPFPKDAVQSALNDLTKKLNDNYP
ncbi:DUF2993 domain-containing protein, partial [Mycobacterium sp. ITM-2017-0098]